MKIYDFDECPLSDRNGSYGGASGSKEGILIHGEPWIVKYPGSVNRLKGNFDIPYRKHRLKAHG